MIISWHDIFSIQNLHTPEKADEIATKRCCWHKEAHLLLQIQKFSYFKNFFIITSNLAHLFYVLLKLNHLLPEIRLLHFPCFEPDIRVVHCEPKNILMSLCATFHHPQILNLLVLFWIPSTKPVIIAPTPWLTSKAADSFTSWYIRYHMSTKIVWRLWTWWIIWFDFGLVIWTGTWRKIRKSGSFLRVGWRASLFR